jgi:hypothetical protein
MGRLGMSKFDSDLWFKADFLKNAATHQAVVNKKGTFTPQYRQFISSSLTTIRLIYPEEEERSYELESRPHVVGPTNHR